MCGGGVFFSLFFSNSSFLLTYLKRFPISIPLFSFREKKDTRDKEPQRCTVCVAMMLLVLVVLLLKRGEREKGRVRGREKEGRPKGGERLFKKRWG